MGRFSVFVSALVLVTGVILAGTAAGDTIRSRLDPGWDDRGPSWSPDGTQILFGESYEPPKGGGDHRLALVRPDGLGLRVLSRPPSDTDEVWDLGGGVLSRRAQLLVTRELGLTDYVVLLKDVVSGAETRLTPPAGQELGGGWSPDGTRIVVVRAAENPTRETPFTERPDGTDARQIAPGSYSVSAGYLPGGRNIVLSRYANGRGSWVAVVPAGGGAERRLTPTGEWAFVDAAPDGERVLLVHRPAESDPALWIANVDGPGRRLLGADDGAWSRAGRWIAYTVGAFTKDHAIHLVHPDGRAHTSSSRAVVTRHGRRTVARSRTSTADRV